SELGEPFKELLVSNPSDQKLHSPKEENKNNSQSKQPMNFPIDACRRHEPRQTTTTTLETDDMTLPNRRKAALTLLGALALTGTSISRAQGAAAPGPGPGAKHADRGRTGPG
ncbi:hypothetical protein P3G55_25655, partial [Leptospira sp. 96542]|nr:hypothetical protein [Leptospira sp. 96542]